MHRLFFYINTKYDHLLCLLIAFLPFSKAIPNIVLFLLIVKFFINFKKYTFLDYLKTSFLFLTILIGSLFFQAILNGSFIKDIDFYQRFLYLIIIPLLFFKVENFNLIKKVSLITINITIIVSLYHIIGFYNIYHFIPMGDGWSTNNVLLLERPYAGMYSIISIILSFDLLQKKDKFKYLYLLSFLLSIFFIFFISIRISTIIIFVLIFVYLLFYLKIKLLKKICFMLAVFAICLLLFKFNKNISNRFFISQNIIQTIKNIEKSEPRVVIWACAKEITLQEDFSIFFGTTSYSNIKNSLVSCYENNIEDYSRKNYFLEHKYNTHSQFIDFYLIGGLLSIILFLSFFVHSIFINRRDFCSVAMIVSFFLFLLIENVFHRQFGCFIFAIFISLYLIKPKTDE